MVPRRPRQALRRRRRRGSRSTPTVERPSPCNSACCSTTSSTTRSPRPAARGFRIAVHAIGNRRASMPRARRVPRPSNHDISGDDDRRFRPRARRCHRFDSGDHLAALDAVGRRATGLRRARRRTVGGGVQFDDHHWLARAGLAEAGVALRGFERRSLRAVVAAVGCAPRCARGQHERRSALRGRSGGAVRRLARRLFQRRRVSRAVRRTNAVRSWPGNVPTSSCSTGPRNDNPKPACLRNLGGGSSCVRSRRVAKTSFDIRTTPGGRGTFGPTCIGVRAPWRCSSEKVRHVVDSSPCQTANHRRDVLALMVIGTGFVVGAIVGILVIGVLVSASR